MLVMKRSMLQSELDTLNHLSKGGQEKVETLTRAMREKVNNAIVKRKNATIGAIDARTECIEISTMNTANFQTKQNPCKQFKEKVSSAISEGSTQAGVLSEYDSVTFLLKSNEGYQTYMTSKMNALKSEIIELDHQLDNLSDDQVYLGEIPESPEFKAVTKKEQPRDSQWLKFDYNSEVKNEQKKDDSTSVAASAESSIPISDWVVNSEAKLGVEMSEAREAMDSANLRATGELLRVFIKRPWFKPSLFENPMLDFVSFIVSEQKEKGEGTIINKPCT